MILEKHGSVTHIKSKILFYCTESHLCSLAHRLHDPGASRASMEFLYKQMILPGQRKGGREKITPRSVCEAKIPFEIFLVPFKVFHQEIFACQLFKIIKKNIYIRKTNHETWLYICCCKSLKLMVTISRCFTS